MYGRAAPNKVVKVPVGTVVYRAGDNHRNVERGVGETGKHSTLKVQLSTFNEEDAVGFDDEGNAKRRTSSFDLSAEPLANAERRMEGVRGKYSTGNVQRSTFDEEAVAAVVGQAALLPSHSAVAETPVLELLVDLTHDGQEYLLAKGGKGGKGNVHFKSSRNRAPRQYTEGEEGEQGRFLLELRTIADAGLVGYPNAGKSTLLRQISAARPKVAPYPFTTLHPIVGIVEFPGYQRATVADIPGLIEGAHRDIGLGHDFLRHITRCRVLIFVVDVAGSEARSPIEDLQQLRKEIDLYDPTLSQRPWFVVANKMDLPDAAENLAELRRRFSKVDVISVSAAKGEGIDQLKGKLGELLVAR
jgi:GTP-binding protein